MPVQGQPRRLEVAVFKDSGVGPSFNDLAAVLRRYEETIHTTILNGEDVREGSLKNFDVFIAPGGSGKKQAASLAGGGMAEIARYVKNGGCYVGICAGCYLAANEPDFLGLLPIGIRDRQHWFRGEGTLPIEFTQAGAEIFGVSPGVADIVYHNGPVLDGRTLLENPQLAKELTVLAFYRGELVAKNGERGVMKGAPAMVLGRYGKGLVLGMSPHAESTPPLNKIIPHALHWLCDHVSAPSSNSVSSANAGAHQITERQADRPHEKRSAPRPAPVPSPAADNQASAGASNQLAQAAYEKANWVFNNVRTDHYQHKSAPAREQVLSFQDGTCEANTDCSGFISYVIESVAHKHYTPIKRMQNNWAHPQAKTYARFFGGLGTAEASDGWLRVASPKELKRGDFIAWKKGSEKDFHHGSGNSGHVMMVIDPPTGISEETVDGAPIRFATVFVLDSSSVYHFKPEQLPPNARQDHRDGVAKGCIRLLLDKNDNPIGYWEGTYWGEGQKPVSKPSYSDEIYFGRMVSNRQ